MGKTLKNSSLKRRDPQLKDLCLVVTYIHVCIQPAMLMVSILAMESLASVDLKWGKNF